MKIEDFIRKYHKHPIAFTEKICGIKFTITQKLKIFICVKFQLLKSKIFKNKKIIKFVNGSELKIIEPTGKISRGKVKELHFDSLE
jgi:hypothetical protein